MTEFKIDPERQCRSLGHKWVTPPHGKSSFYDNMRNKGLKICKRCRKWSDDDSKK